MTTPDFELLGSFYLGRERTPDGHPGPLLLYDSKDLVTHAVCVGMTGSGKTGLCVGILEEAAIDAIPSIVIDPKGDLANLLLAFPELRPQDFRPWINLDDAQRQGVDPDEFARRQAERWRAGLAEWGQDGPRIARLQSAAEFAVYTPGSNAARPVSILRSFAAPSASVREDSEVFNERIASTATGLLGLLGIDADPLQSREHILLSTVLHRAWEAGEDLDLGALIARIQSPGVSRIGVMELETFFPAADRFRLAMSLNNLIASPGFARWLEGEALDVGALLHGAGGRPRVSIFSIAHLNDAERMFFVSLLLNEVLAWVRTQRGTTSLRALVYMDEIAGYFPPVANPPSKQPLLTLMKQARAFGVGVILATQNPVDLDYKGLSNAGTWFIGRLQTERDKARVLDGLEGAMSSAGGRFDRAEIDRLLSGLGSRVFLMNNVHDDGPVVFETRWALSYLRGPMTRAELRLLASASAHEAQKHAPDAERAPAPSAAPPARAPAASVQRPVLPPEVPQFFLPLRGPRGTGPIVYRPMLLGSGRIHYEDARLGVETDEIVCVLAEVSAGPVTVDWDAAPVTDLTEEDLEREPRAGAAFEAIPAEAGKPRNYEQWKKALGDTLYRTRRVELARCPGLKLIAEPGEDEHAFRLRVEQRSREERDGAVERLREKHAPKFQTLHERLRRAEQQVESQREQAKAAKYQTAVSFGSAVLGALLGRKKASSANVGRAATAARGVGRASKEASDVERARETVDALRAQIAELEAKVSAEVQTIADEQRSLAADLDSVSLKPKKTQIAVRTVVLAWGPCVRGSDNSLTPGW
ncbi:MAG TPA: ATP-binding protein [Phycisphaerales bacterium]|nr:ATP-binding protein [Phycisphaerales bacterium]